MSRKIFAPNVEGMYFSSIFPYNEQLRLHPRVGAHSLHDSFRVGVTGRRNAPT